MPTARTDPCRECQNSMPRSLQSRRSDKSRQRSKWGCDSGPTHWKARGGALLAVRPLPEVGHRSDKQSEAALGSSGRPAAVGFANLAHLSKKWGLPMIDTLLGLTPKCSLAIRHKTLPNETYF